MDNPICVTVRHNWWRVPNQDRVFDGWLEGSPSPQERAQALAKAATDRLGWVPSSEALAVAEKLKEFSGNRVLVQMWDSCMSALPEEGPSPFEACCKGLIVVTVDGFQQAFLEVSDVRVIPTREGYDPNCFLHTHPESVFALVPLAELYEVRKL